MHPILHCAYLIRAQNPPISKGTKLAIIDEISNTPTFCFFGWGLSPIVAIHGVHDY